MALQVVLVAARVRAPLQAVRERRVTMVAQRQHPVARVAVVVVAVP